MLIGRLARSLLSRMGLTVKRRRPGIRRLGTGNGPGLAPGDLMAAIHGTDIYEGFAFSTYAPDLQGWGSDSPAFRDLISETRPDLVIEVGSWKGGSAITMANALRDTGRGTVLCIDTWLGSLEFRNSESGREPAALLECLHGYPQVYFRFLANVCHAGHQGRIVPFPLPSSAAALWLLRNGTRADLIYIDASHEEQDVYQDLLDYFELVRPGGILFGDDWEWTGVRAAVERFAREEGLPVGHRHDKWLLRNPGRRTA